MRRIQKKEEANQKMSIKTEECRMCGRRFMLKSDSQADVDKLCGTCYWDRLKEPKAPLSWEELERRNKAKVVFPDLPLIVEPKPQ